MPYLIRIAIALAALLVHPPSSFQASASGREHALDWQVGEWEGTRRDAGDGSEDRMVMRVETILGGAGHTREMEITHAGGVYRGFAVQVFDPEEKLWRRSYVNDVRRTFASLEGTAEGDRSIWRSTSPGRTRESRLVSERPSSDAWHRTMSVSADDGATWRVLWIDELEKTSD